MKNGLRRRAANDFTYSTGYFSEDFIDNDEILELWPKDLALDDKVNIEADEYVNDCLSAIDNKDWESTTGTPPPAWRIMYKSVTDPDRKMSWPEVIDPPPVTDVAVVSRETGVIEYDHEKRFVKALFQAIARMMAKLGQWLTRKVVSRLQKLKDRGGFKTSPPNKGAKPADQKWASNQIKNSKNWDNCLKGSKFEKYF